MTQTNTINRQLQLASRPVGAPTDANFQLATAPVPSAGPGQLLLRTVFLSLDPYMRGRISDAASYAAPVAVGATMVGTTVCRVETSQHTDYAVGDWVLAYTGWQDYTTSDGTGLTKLDPKLAPPSYALGVLGMPGFTAYMGLLDIGAPKAGETVVAAATGAVGSVVGQIAKLKGCHVVGIAGGPRKCKSAVDELGFDACIDHHSPDCSPLLMRTLLTKRIRMQGFIIFDDYRPSYSEFAEDMGQWLKQGKVRVREDIVDGLEHAPQAFIGLLEGKNFGKLIVQVVTA